MDTYLPEKLYSAEQAKKLDHIAIKELGILGFTLMNRAAKFSYYCLKRRWPEARSIIVVCGGGNNGGDGYALAALAKKEGKAVSVFYLIDPETLNGDAIKAYQSVLANHIQPKLFSVTEFNNTNADIVVDALFGIGLDRHVEGLFYEAIKAINDKESDVLSIDVPSGLNANTGHAMGIAVKANLTATFIGLKKGMFTGYGPEYSGAIKFNNLDVPSETYRHLDKFAASRLIFKDLQQILIPRQRNSYKNNFGHVLIIGGDQGYIGAARMAAEAAARVGSGLVSIATRTSHSPILSLIRPEIMSHGIENIDELVFLLNRADVVAIGPGLGHTDWARQLFMAAIGTKLPLVIDADALQLLAEVTQPSKDWVLTPHPGEAAYLLNIDSKRIQSDRYQAIIDLKCRFWGPVVLKGSGTLVADTQGHIFVCTAGNPGMSSGGMGDVLTGIIAGLIAQGIDVDTAAKLGVCLHAHAADDAASNGERGLLALDLMPYLRALVNPDVD